MLQFQENPKSLPVFPHPNTPPPSRLTFLDLPREIRDIIYKLVLISPTSLIAWSGMPFEKFSKTPVVFSDPRHWYQKEITPQTFDVAEYEINSLPVERLVVSMALVSRDVSRESAEVFWSNNSFRFVGDKWIWDTVLQWLIGIGPTNRRYLSHLEFQFQRQQRVWQLADPLGARTQLDAHIFGPDTSFGEAVTAENAREIVYPRNRHLVFPQAKTIGEQHALEGAVENVSPKVEVVMKMLARPGKWAKIRLTMLLPTHLVPGEQYFAGGRLLRPFGRWMSMDLPNVMEICREKHVRDGGRDLEILWKCKDFGLAFRKGRVALELHGWEILHESYHNYSSLSKDWDTFFTMKRKPLREPVKASYPSQQSSLYFF